MKSIACRVAYLQTVAGHGHVCEMTDEEFKLVSDQITKEMVANLNRNVLRNVSPARGSLPRHH